MHFKDTASGLSNALTEAFLLSLPFPRHQIAPHARVAVLAARNEALGQAAAEKLRKEAGLENVQFRKLDLASSDSIAAFAEGMKRTWRGWVGPCVRAWMGAVGRWVGRLCHPIPSRPWQSILIRVSSLSTHHHVPFHPYLDRRRL